MTRSVVVASRAAVIATTGSIFQPTAKWSETATDQYPRSSICRSLSRHSDIEPLRAGMFVLKRNAFAIGSPEEWESNSSAAGTTGGAGRYSVFSARNTARRDGAIVISAHVRGPTGEIASSRLQSFLPYCV